MGLRDIETTLPPGFRFYPSDEELICHYLYKKVSNDERVLGDGTMVEVDLHAREPWELPDVAKLSANEWYFFSFRDRKYATGPRTNRATRSGYWKATGKDRTVYHPSTKETVGMRKTLVFYRGRAPNGIKTSWVMHEFRLEKPHTLAKEDWVLCRVSHKRKGEKRIGMGSVSSPPSTGNKPVQGLSYLENINDVSISNDINAPHQETNTSSSFLDVENLLQCNNFTPQGEMEEFGLLLSVGSEDNAMGYGNSFVDLGSESVKDEDEFCSLVELYRLMEAAMCD